MSAVIARPSDIVPTGLPFGSVRWGVHLGHLYETAADLEEVATTFFAAGIANHEKCIWIVDAPLDVAHAERSLAARVADLDERMHEGQIAIISRADWLVRMGTSSERRIEHWFERERIALADGFAGLRVTSDTAWGEAAPRRDLVTHEARVHRALHGHRITVLCSYPLDRCGRGEIHDVLRNHKSVVMRRDGVWEHLGAAAALGLVAPLRGSQRTIELFEPGDFPASSMARRLGDALTRNHAALALCSREHLAALRVAIERRLGDHAALALADGRLLLLDADTVFAEVSEAPDFEAAIEAQIGVPMRDLVQRYARVRVYGELVDVCCQRGRCDLAIRMEQWWSVQTSELPIELHCGYRVASFDGTDTSAFSPELQHQLASNRELRPRVAETVAIGSREHLVVLQSVTSALGEAVTFDNIGAVVTAELAPAVGAARIGLVIGGQLIALRGITTPEEPAAVAQLLEHLPAQWSEPATQSHETTWIGGALVAVLPLVFATERIGTLFLGFERPTLSLSLHALVDDLVCQLALAVERARVYEQATHDRVRAERASAAKDQFLAMLGHELRNPLSPILSATQLMRLREPEQLVKERSTIEKSVTHMIRLVDDLLDVSQIARGEIALAREPTDLADLVERALATARGVIDERAQFAVAVPHSLIVDVDPGRILQVLVNLVVNATKYTNDQDCVEIAARARGEMVELVVRDHGYGIEPALLPYVFDLFVQGKQGADRAKGGLGVGLAIARSIIELHGGTITAASEGEGTGSTFTINLPRWQIERNTDQIEVPAAVGGRRILVVDDNEDAAWLLAEALRLLGHDVRLAYEGVSALELAHEWAPEVALLDIGLPGMNGFELCRELGKLASRPHCIAVSGYGQPKDRALAREAGFEAHFVKPVDLRDVQAAIDALSSSN